jgi:hypothetical protein
MALDKFIPLSPDPDLNVGSDMTLARFGHLNQVVDYINAGCAGGSTIYVNGSGINSVNKSETIGNFASGAGSVILNGTNNTASGDCSTILNGSNSIAAGVFSLLHGNNSCATSSDSVILGGNNNKAYGYNATIFGSRNTVKSNNLADYHNTIAGGADNVTEGWFGFIGNGVANKLLGVYGNGCNAIVGGEQNCISSLHDVNRTVGTNFIGAGRFNRILYANTPCVNSIHSTIAGGCSNCIIGYNYGTIPGGAFNRIDNGAAPGRQEGGVISGGVFNTVSINHGSLMGSTSSTVTGQSSTIIGGSSNNITSACSSVLGGSSNNANQPYSAVFGCGITTSMACAFHTNRLVLTNLPNSSAGLPSGAVWYDPADGNRVKYVP